jgi:hypothetical protein
MNALDNPRGERGEPGFKFALNQQSGHQAADRCRSSLLKNSKFTALRFCRNVSLQESIWV